MSHFWASQNTPLGSQGTELWETNIYIWCFYLKAIYNSCKLQRLLQVPKFFLLQCVLPYTNIVFLFRHLYTEVFIFINVASRWSVSVVIASFFWEQVLLIFQLLSWFRVKFKQGFGNHLSGTKVRIWIHSEYNAVFTFSCLTSCNLTNPLTFSFISFLSEESDSEYFRQSTCTFYASQILLFKVFNMRVSWQVKCQLIGALSLMFEIQWIHCQYL